MRSNFMRMIEIIQHLVSCKVCHGMGVIELPNGDTVRCQACNGKGIIK